MVSLGRVIESLVPGAEIIGYYGNKEVVTEAYTALVIEWQDARPVPTWDEVVAEKAVLEAVDAAEVAAETAAEGEFTASFFNGKTYDEISAAIDNALDLPTKAQATTAINNLPESAALKTLLGKIAYAVIEEGNYLKALARNLAAALKKAKYIE